MSKRGKSSTQTSGLGLKNEAMEDLEALGQITNTNTGKVLVDALRLYEWVLQSQLNGDKIVILKDGQVDAELDYLITDTKTAQDYFADSE